MISTSLGFQDKMYLNDSNEIILSIPISRGWNKVMMHVLDSPSLTQLPYGDPRTLLLQIRSWKIVEFKMEEK